MNITGAIQPQNEKSASEEAGTNVYEIVYEAKDEEAKKEILEMVETYTTTYKRYKLKPLSNLAKRMLFINVKSMFTEVLCSLEFNRFSEYIQKSNENSITFDEPIFLKVRNKDGGHLFELEIPLRNSAFIEPKYKSKPLLRTIGLYEPIKKVLADAFKVHMTDKRDSVNGMLNSRVQNQRTKITKLVDDNPILVLSFQAQQLTRFRN